jgi:hypothetical protein
MLTAMALSPFNGSGLNNYGYAGSFPVGGDASTNFATLMDDGGVLSVRRQR